MVQIRPFRGLRYRLDSLGGASVLLAPPYDVIDEQLRATLEARSLDNCVRVIVPAGDGEKKYDNAASEFQRLVSDSLVRDERPGYYLYEQHFSAQGRSFVRRGFVGLIELTPFGAGQVKPHERTLARPKADRLALMRSCDAHLELVFGLFSDPENRWLEAVESGGSASSLVLDCVFDEVRHVLHRLDDESACRRLSEVLSKKSVYIADGHHRYETMCAYAHEHEHQSDHRFGMVYLSNLDDAGLVILPTHRLVHDVAPELLVQLYDKLAREFKTTILPLPSSHVELEAIVAQASRSSAAFVLGIPGSGEICLVTLADGYRPSSTSHSSLARLDVAVLHAVVLEEHLGIDKIRQAAKANLEYTRDGEIAWRTLVQPDGRTQLVCFMHPVRVTDVVAVCDSGEVMPQKSTFFYPKIPTGLVFHAFNRDAN